MYLTQERNAIEEILARVEHQLNLRFLQRQLEEKNLEFTKKNEFMKQEIRDRRQSKSEIRLLLTVSNTIDKLADLDAAFKAILRILCRSIHWNFAEAWIPREDGTVLDCHRGYYAREPVLKTFCEESCQLIFQLG